MFIRVTRSRFYAANEAELRRIGQVQLSPAYHRMPGFRSEVIGADRQTGRLVSITSWDTEEQALAVREALGDVVSQLQAAGLEIDTAETYEVLA